MTISQSLIDDYLRHLKKAMGHFEFSYRKIQLLPTAPAELDDSALETWESFSNRFSRVVDIYLIKILRAMVLQKDPGFEGALRDFADQAEKLGMIASADSWMKMRELRNINAHEYREDKLTEYLNDLKKYAPEILKLKSILK